MEPRVRFQAQFLTEKGEWWDVGYPEKFAFAAHRHLRSFAISKTRIIKATTTFEVVEEMEPKA